MSFEKFVAIPFCFFAAAALVGSLYNEWHRDTCPKGGWHNFVDDDSIKPWQDSGRVCNNEPVETLTYHVQRCSKCAAGREVHNGVCVCSND
jgi:hypothetical protein